MEGYKKYYNENYNLCFETGVDYGKSLASFNSEFKKDKELISLSFRCDVFGFVLEDLVYNMSDYSLDVINDYELIGSSALKYYKTNASFINLVLLFENNAEYLRKVLTYMIANKLTEDEIFIEEVNSYFVIEDEIKRK